ncbi:MAG: DUF4183 domain-containing protein [Clostridiaceae bacterium]|nr:DUF4183 domain-containing protein [Clostridiaceae bacterium]
MAATLFKLAITASTTTTVNTKPDVQKFFYLFDPDDLDNGTLTIEAEDFVDDQGDAITTIPEAEPDNGYYLLFINGVLQQEGLYTVTDESVVVQDAGDIEPEASIVLVVTNFASDASSNTTVNT